MASLYFWQAFECNVAAIGHETPDTDAPAAGLGWVGERYMLQQDKFQIELMKNCDRMPPKGAVLFCSWLKVKGAVGFTAGCGLSDRGLRDVPPHVKLKKRRVLRWTKKRECAAALTAAL